MRYYVDIDGIICTNMFGKYEDAVPIQENIDKINRLYDGENEVVLWTARGTTTNIDWRELTEKQMKEWGVQYHRLELGKPNYDFFIDDKMVDISQI